jgi:hypothetical protein
MILSHVEDYGTYLSFQCVEDTVREDGKFQAPLVINRKWYLEMVRLRIV